MSNTKHTPGPWTYHVGLDYISIESANEHDNSFICEWRHFSDDDGESEANAKLIAAAPELLETLERIKPYTGYLPSGFKEEVENAIKKATE